MTERSRTDHLEMVLSEIREMRDDIKMLDKAIRGNGTPGLNQRVAILEARFRYMAGSLLAGLPIVYDWLKRHFGF